MSTLGEITPIDNASGSTSPLPLSPHDLADLRASGLTDATIRAAGLYTVEDPRTIRDILRWRCSLDSIRELGPCLAIPYHDLAGKRINGYTRLKPSRPRVQRRPGKPDKPIKYESPVGLPNRAYFPPGALEAIRSPGQHLLLTEGEKKALAATQHGFACIGLVGVWGWHRKRERSPDGRTVGGRELIADLAAIDWRGRNVTIVYDSDAVSNPAVRFAEQELVRVLRRLLVAVEILRLPPGPLGADGQPAKVGLDDYLLAHTRDDFLGLFSAVELPIQRSKLNTSSRGQESGSPMCLTSTSKRRLTHGPVYREIVRAAGRAPFCVSHAVPLLESLKEDRLAAILRVGCRRYSCPSCSLTRKAIWLKHFAATLESVRGSVYLWSGDAEEARLARQKAAKCKANYLSVSTSPGVIMSPGIVVLVVEVEITGATLVSHDAALEELAKAIHHWKTGGQRSRPCLTSAGWKLAEREKPKKWKRRGAAPTGCYRDAVNLIRGAGLNPREKDSVATVDLPDNLDTDDFFFSVQELLPIRVKVAAQ